MTTSKSKGSQRRDWSAKDLKLMERLYLKDRMSYLSIAKAIGNVTIVDHLSRRLAYVEGSQNSTLESEFFVNPTGKDSAILRWEIAEPMEVGQSAQVTFKCRVR